MRAWSMAVRLLVSAGLEFRNVRLHRVVGELQLDAIVAGAAFLALAECKFPRIGNKATVPRVNALGLFAFFGGGVLVMNFVLAAPEEISLAVVSIAKGVIVVEDEIQIVK